MLTQRRTEEERKRFGSDRHFAVQEGQWLFRRAYQRMLHKIKTPLKMMALMPAPDHYWRVKS
jgi:hypothetical protein